MTWDEPTPADTPEEITEGPVMGDGEGFGKLPSPSPGWGTLTLLDDEQEIMIIEELIRIHHKPNQR